MTKFTWAQLVDKSNSAFKKMNKARKRVAIAKDVIKALDTKLITANGGQYLVTNLKDKTIKPNYYSDDIQLWDLARQRGNESFKDYLPKIKSCEVCAKGAIFVCTVARRNQITNRDTYNQCWNGSELSNSLGEIFTGDQLNLIEQYFEGCLNYWENLGIYEDDSKMKSIMNNIIKNKGTFIPV